MSGALHSSFKLTLKAILCLEYCQKHFENGTQQTAAIICPIYLLRKKKRRQQNKVHSKLFVRGVFCAKLAILELNRLK